MPSLDTPMSYHRLRKASLDDSEIFTNLKDLMDYCKNGASYDGQRVAVITNTLGTVEYVIRNNIPMIDMRGSEPIFKELTFDGDNTSTHGLLIYDQILTNVYTLNDIFTFDYDKLCIISQLEIFRIIDSDASNSYKYKFYMERMPIARKTGASTTDVYTWTQNYNPYTHDNTDNINRTAGDYVREMSFTTSKKYNEHLLTNNTDISLMPIDESIINKEKYVTKIYVKAEDYYNACK